jgi:hypothetical protein
MEKTFIALPLGCFLLILAGMLAFLAGWIANIVQLCYMLDGPITGYFIAKVVGTLVAPLGAVLGWVGMF